MTRITIDNQNLEVDDSLTVMQAAAHLGIEIPSLCHLYGYDNHPTCMVCLVKDAKNGKMFPSCAMLVQEGMNIITHSPDLREARRDALELLLSDHVGDCEAPCRLTCPAFMNIPLMNRFITMEKFEMALNVVHEEIALPLILGHICPAPCEKACRRKPIDGTVSICLLKRFTADDYIRRTSGINKAPKTGKRVAVIGTGPAGLSAAFYLLMAGNDCVLFEKNELPGGALRYSIPDDKLPKETVDAEIEVLRLMGAMFEMNCRITSGNFFEKILQKFDAVILATGSKISQPIGDFGLLPDEQGEFYNRNTFESLSRRGVFLCGNIIKDQNMAVRAGAQGKLAAREASIYLNNPKQIQYYPQFNSAFGHLSKAEEEEYLKESVSKNRTEPFSGFIAGFTPSEAVDEAKRCMHCDCRKPVSCKLRKYADQYGANRKKYSGPTRKQMVKNIQHSIVIYEPEKCIKCGLCVEITNREAESLGLTYVGRGFDVSINVPFNLTLREGLLKAASACVTACPTGALSLKEQEENIS
jgi:ferredoxin